MKDNIVSYGIVLIMLVLFFVYPFSMWGGYPEGLWWKVERYQKENEERLESLEQSKQIIELHKQIEVLQTQMSQLRPPKRR